jgi:hypothetical protein
MRYGSEVQTHGVLVDSSGSGLSCAAGGPRPRFLRHDGRRPVSLRSGTKRAECRHTPSSWFGESLVPYTVVACRNENGHEKRQSGLVDLDVLRVTCFVVLTVRHTQAFCNHLRVLSHRRGRYWYGNSYKDRQHQGVDDSIYGGKRAQIIDLVRYLDIAIDPQEDNVGGPVHVLICHFKVERASC